MLLFIFFLLDLLLLANVVGWRNSKKLKEKSNENKKKEQQTKFTLADYKLKGLITTTTTTKQIKNRIKFSMQQHEWAKK